MIPYKVFETFAIEKNRAKPFSHPHRRHGISKRASLHRQVFALERPEHRMELLAELHAYVQRYEDEQKMNAPAAVTFPEELVKRELFLQCKAWGWRGKEKHASPVKLGLFLRTRGSVQPATPVPRVPQAELTAYVTRLYRNLYLQYYPEDRSADPCFCTREIDISDFDRPAKKQLFRDFVGHGRSKQFNISFVKKTGALNSAAVSYVPTDNLPEEG